MSQLTVTHPRPAVGATRRPGCGWLAVVQTSVVPPIARARIDQQHSCSSRLCTPFGPRRRAGATTHLGRRRELHTNFARSLAGTPLFCELTPGPLAEQTPSAHAHVRGGRAARLGKPEPREPNEFRLLDPSDNARKVPGAGRGQQRPVPEYASDRKHRAAWRFQLLGGYRQRSSAL